MTKAMPQSMRALTSETTEEWYTPLIAIRAVRAVLGAIDLDPASDPYPNEWIGARHIFTQADNGLSREWSLPDGSPSRVFLNPPFGGVKARKWTNKLMLEYNAGRVSEAILLVNAAPGYDWFEYLWRERIVCMVRNRMAFVPAPGYVPREGSDGRAKKGQCFAYFGPAPGRFADTFQIFGRIIPPDKPLFTNCLVDAAMRISSGQ